MKKILTNHSKLLLIITILEIILSVYFLMYLGYVDKLNYIESSTNTVDGLTLLLQNMYTSTWWGLIILSVNFIGIFTLTSIIYKKNYLHFISILIWITLFILAIDLTKGIKYNISNICIFIPIIALNIVAYFNELKHTTKK